MKPRPYIGVSGFSYPGWKGSFYPEGLRNEEFLAYYSQHLKSVEINSSFYAPPSSVMVKSWSSKTPTGFRFAFKAPRQITHILKLGKGAPEVAARLSTALGLLDDDKNGPVLFQLPPYLKQDLKVLDEFLSKTNTVKNRVFEFRHNSWFQEPTYKMLEKHDTGFCVAETEDMNPVMKATSSLAYFRLRKDHYDEKTLDDWSGKIKGMTSNVEEAYVYLRHDETGENVKLAMKMAEMLA